MTGRLLATIAAAPLEWRLLCTTLAAVSTCLVLLPPRSKAARASFVMVGVGIMVATILPWLRHPAWAVAGLPIIVAAGPVAAWRRARPQPETLPVTFVTTRLALAFAGAVLFLWGVTGTGNAAVLTTIGAIAVMGACPIHRPSSELLRHAGVDLRPLLVLLMGPLTWNVVAAHEGLAWSASWLESLGLLSLWLGSLLLAAGGDLARLSTAALLVTCGQLVTMLGLSPGSAGITTAASAGSLVLLSILMSRLEATAGVREIAEIGGLLRQTPRLAWALIGAWLWFVGNVGWNPLRGFWSIWMATASRGSALEFWPVLVPQVLAAWGAVRFLDAVIPGPARAAVVPEPLRDRMPPAARSAQPLSDLSARECLAVVILAVVGGLAGR